MKKIARSPGNGTPSGIVNGMSDYAVWEDKVTFFLEEHLEVCRSDAQGIVEVQHFTVTQAWGLGLDAEEAGKRVIKASETLA
jgi:hypothetical protein